MEKLQWLMNINIGKIIKLKDRICLSNTELSFCGLNATSMQKLDDGN